MKVVALAGAIVATALAAAVFAGTARSANTSAWYWTPGACKSELHNYGVQIGDGRTFNVQQAYCVGYHNHCWLNAGLRRYKVYRLHVGIFQSMDGERTIYGAPKGTPDYICAHGVYRSFLLEVKRPGGKLRPDQEIEIALLREQFGLAIVVASSTDELGNFLARHERSP